MIIKATRIATTSGAGAVAAHVLRGEKNERIELLRGSEVEMHAAMRDAESAGAKYGLRHYKISPAEEMTSEDARQVLADLAEEFGFDPDRATLIEHQKPRAGGAGFNRHWHAIVPEVDAITGRVLDAHWMRPRHEKIARIAEARLGHEVVPGRFNGAVQRHLEAEGRHDVAERIQHATEVPRPREGYATNIHQMHNRKGNDLPADRLAVREAWERSDNGQAFQAALAEHGIEVRPGKKEGVYIAVRDQDFLGAIHRLVGVPKHEVGERLTAAPLEQPVPPAPEPPAPQPEPPNPGDGVPLEISNVTNLESAAPSQDAAAAPAEAPAAATATPAPAPKGGSGGGGGGGSSPAPAAEAPKQGGGDLFGADDPTAGIEPPKPGDLAGELRYREQVMKRAEEIARRKAAQRTPTPQQGGKNGNSQTGGGGGGGSDKSAAALAAAAHEALLELIERGRKAATQREFNAALEAYIAAATERRNHHARRGAAEPHRDSVAPERTYSGPSQHSGARPDSGDDAATRRGEPYPAPGDSRHVGQHHGGDSADREGAGETFRRHAEAARVKWGFEGVDLTRARAAHDEMKNGPRPDPLEGLRWEEAKARKDEFRAQLWEQFRDDGRVLFEFDKMERDEVRRAEIEAAEPIRAKMRERWHSLNPAQMKRAREIIAANIKAAGDEVRERQKARPKRDFNDYMRGLASCFGDERAVFVVRFDERTAARKAALFTPIEQALESIAQERATAPRPRNPDEEGKAARRALWEPHDAAQERLREARAAFERMERPKGWRWLNGAAYDAYDKARDRMHAAQAEVDEAMPSPSKLDDAEHKARFSAQVGQGEHQRWQAAHGHRLDQREAALLAVRDAMQGGDKQMIRTMRGGGMDAALELQRKRDEEEKRQREAALRAANVLQMRQQNRQGIEAPTPRIR